MQKITLLFSFLLVSVFGFSQNGGDTCETAVAVTPGTFTATLITQGSGGSEMGTGSDAAWFVFTATDDGLLSINSCGGGADSYLSIGTGTCGALTVEGQNDDACASGLGNNYASNLTIVVASGADYYIEWDDRYTSGANAFDWELSFSGCIPPSVDPLVIVNDCSNSEFSIEVPITDLGNSTTLTISNNVGVASTIVTATGTAIAGPFPTGSTVNLTIEHENNPDCNLTGGPFADTCPPTNDECAGAIAVDCDGTVTGSTAGATDSGGNSNTAKDLWYSYTGSGTPEDVTVTLCNSSYDTVVRVYSDCSVSSASQVLFNDDACGTRSQGTFSSDGSTTYYILVEGFGSASGAFELTVTCAANVSAPANDLCVNAEALSLDVVASGTTAGATDNSTGGLDDTTCQSFVFKSDVWYTFVATDDSVSVVTTITGSSDQANVAVYDYNNAELCTQLDANSLVCSNGNGGESVDVTGLVADNIYYIRVWSDGVAPRQTEARTEGTFNIVVNDALLSTIDFENANAFTYYPNPVRNELTLKAQSNIQNVSIYNMLGQEVSRTAPNALQSDVNMNQLQSGSYFVKVTINDSTETIRVIKQ